MRNDPANRAGPVNRANFVLFVLCSHGKFYPGYHFSPVTVHLRNFSSVTEMIKATLAYRKIGPHCVLERAFIHDTCTYFSTKRNFRHRTTFGIKEPWFHLFCLEILGW